MSSLLGGIFKKENAVLFVIGDVDLTFSKFIEAKRKR